MAKLPVKTTKKAYPKIYAYTTPGVVYHDGWTKIGYTEEKDATVRIGHQTNTADIRYIFEWALPSIYDDNYEIFKDTDFHVYLVKRGYEKREEREWFHILPDPAKKELIDFKGNRGLIKSDDIRSYQLRSEQEEAVSRAKDYFLLHERGEYLWNAKPRFGKTLSAYDLCKRLDAKNVLIVTNRPAIANSWYEDYSKFLGIESGYLFVSEVDALKGDPKKYKNVLTREKYEDFCRVKKDAKCIEFVSLQDLKGSIWFGGKYKKLKEISETKWDLLIIDEAHEGVDTYKTDVAFDHIERKYTLHLSGTPFKALANDKFPSGAIYNWTYADEQKAKSAWQEESSDSNPYEDLPQLNLFTYRMSEMVRKEISKGGKIDEKEEGHYFDLSLFFEYDPQKDRFVHDADVNNFLTSLTTKEKFPFSTEELRDELKHTLWILNRVDSARALAKKLERHEVFKEYKIILAAGDGRLDDEDEIKKSYDKVKAAIDKYDKTITLSVGQLTTGVTIPEWTAVLMLANMKSPSLYMQAAFRAQNPCLFNEEGEFKRKENAYVFDFDPARTLDIFEQFANDLSSGTSGGKGDSNTRKANVKELLNFFPVLGEDPEGKMVALDAADVLTIPRKLRSKEVVDHGFMSNYLFQNISNVFSAPPEVLEKIKQMMPAKDVGAMGTIDKDTAEELSLNDEGEIDLPDEIVIGDAKELFGDKIFGEVEDFSGEIIGDFEEESGEEEEYISFEAIRKSYADNVVSPMLERSKEAFGSALKENTQNALDRKMKADAEIIIKRNKDDFRIEKAKLDEEREKALDKATTDEETKDIEKVFEKEAETLAKDFKKKLFDDLQDAAQNSGKEIVKQVKTDILEQEKSEKESSIKDHLRGFSRTIPAFLMAYGDEETTLENFDTIIPEDVFKEVTSISIADFRFLRDGGDWIDPDTGESKHFDGHLFDPIVFNDSVKEFLNLKKELANYFEEGMDKDIFSYIPPQKTNQIFTPKNIVIEMVDKLEEENPGCFDDPDKTFVDFYMKSGMYITEIVKRLYNSPKIKKLYPDEKERLKHIFEKQVFGLAPTEIIYRITLSYILGFKDDYGIEKHNIRKCDVLPLMKKGVFEEEMQKLFGDSL